MDATNGRRLLNDALGRQLLELASDTRTDTQPQELE